MKNILILNGSLSGKEGNTQSIIELIQNKMDCCEVIHLSDFQNKSISFWEIKNKIIKADAFVFTSGTYWDNWGSPLQLFLEAATELEGTDFFLGKPAAVIITMHSVGGKSVLSRLQGVLNTMGFMIPPMTGMVYSLAAHLALKTESSFSEDFWSLEDTNTIVHNLLASMSDQKYMAWPVDIKDAKRNWIR
jgi:multimeric flavodoxin WrbA